MNQPLEDYKPKKLNRNRVPVLQRGIKFFSSLRIRNDTLSGLQYHISRAKSLP